MDQKFKTAFITEAAWLRAIACLNVVLIHITANPLYYVTTDPNIYAQYGAFTQHQYLVLNQFTRFAVPSFVFLTGFTLAWRHVSGRAPFEFGSFIRRRFLVVFVPYAVWSLYYFVFVQATSGGFSSLAHSDWGGLAGRFIHELLVGDACYHMYFVILILQLYLLAPLFILAAQRFYSFKTWLAAGFVYQLIASIVNYYYISATGIPFWDMVISRLDRNCVMWLGYFIIGIAVGGQYERIRGWIIRFGVYAIIPWLLLWHALIWEFYYSIGQGRFFSGVVTSSKPLVMLYCLAFLPLIFWVGNKMSTTRLNPVLLNLSEHSYGIFLAHPVVITAFQYRFFWADHPFSIGASLLLFALCVCIPWGIIVLGSYLYSRFQSWRRPHPDTARSRSLQNSG